MEYLTPRGPQESEAHSRMARIYKSLGPILRKVPVAHDKLKGTHS